MISIIGKESTFMRHWQLYPDGVFYLRHLIDWFQLHRRHQYLLELGDQGEVVRVLQELLKAQGLFTCTLLMGTLGRIPRIVYAYSKIEWG